MIVTILVSLLFRPGLAFRSLPSRRRTCRRAHGLDVRLFQIAAFTLGSAIAGIGGALYAHHFSYVEAQHFSIALSITIVLYVLLGGSQSVLGPVWRRRVHFAAGLLRGSARWRYVIFAAILIVVMVLRPQGLITRGQLRWLPHRKTSDRPEEQPA